jgi:RNA polymerase primary sigma factor
MAITAPSPSTRRVAHSTARSSPRDGDDERAAVLAARRSGERGRTELIELFLPRIAIVAGNYAGVRAVSREELIQAGVLGLLSALERYDPERENQFWTYARWWVRRAMQELVSSLGNVVVFSDRAQRQLARVNAAHREHLQSRGREPSLGDLALVTGLTTAQVTSLIGAAQPAHALDERADMERPGVRFPAGLLRDAASEDDFEHATLRVAAKALPTALATLSARELAIIRARHGIEGEQRSLRDLAGGLRVSAERVRQIERDAMRKLRESCDPTVSTTRTMVLAGREDGESPGAAT